MTDIAFQKCISPDCGETYDVTDAHVACPKCGELLDVTYDWDRARVPTSWAEFERLGAQRHDPLRFSGVWRFHELLPFAEPRFVVTVGEGQTLLRKADVVAEFVGLNANCLTSADFIRTIGIITRSGDYV